MAKDTNDTKKPEVKEVSPGVKEVSSDLYKIKYIGHSRKDEKGETIPHRIGSETLDPFGYFSLDHAKSLVKNSPKHFKWADTRTMPE